jgi:hypothetical protein
MLCTCLSCYKDVGSPLEIPKCIESLHERDQQVLNHLCDMYNILRNQTISAELQYRNMACEATERERDVIHAVQHLQSLRHHVEQTFKYAQQEVIASPKCRDAVLYVPKELRQYGNVYSLSTSFVYLSVYP